MSPNTLASDLEKGSGLLLERIVGELYRKYTVTGQYILHPTRRIIFKQYTSVITKVSSAVHKCNY